LKGASRLSVWWRALRYHYTPPSLFPAVLGATVSWAVDRAFLPFFFVLAVAGVMINHLGLNMADDYYDYKHAVDQAKPGEKNPYSGGSGTLSSGLIAPPSMLRAFAACFCITAAIGLYLAYARGLPVLFFGLFGVFCSVFYTAPPVSFSHHGFGELAQLLSFGPVIGLGAYFVQAQGLSLGAFIATFPLGIMLFSMITINEIPDYSEDRMAGKLTLIARYGRLNGVKLYIASWACTYAVIAVGLALQILPVAALLAFLSLPLALRSIARLRANYEDPLRMAPANLDMIRAHGITSMGLIAGYAILGLTGGANAAQLVVILCLLVVLYLPVAIELVKPHKQS